LRFYFFMPLPSHKQSIAKTALNKVNY